MNIETKDLEKRATRRFNAQGSIMRKLRLQEVIRFWSNVDKGPGHGPKGDCWLWRGTKTCGYGYFQPYRYPFPRKPMRAPIYCFGAECGPIPDGLLVLHTCDIKSCVNPGHLYLGTAAHNSRDHMLRGCGRGKGPLLPKFCCDVIQSEADLGMQHQVLSLLFRVSEATITNIVKGRFRKRFSCAN